MERPCSSAGLRTCAILESKVPEPTVPLGCACRMTGGPWSAGTVVPGTEVPFCPPVLLVGWPASAAPPLLTPVPELGLEVPTVLVAAPPQAAAATSIAMTTRTLFIWNGLLGV